MYTITFNGSTAKENNIYIVKRPSIPAPKRRVTTTAVPGRDGALIEFDGSYEPITIPVSMNFISDSADDWAEDFRTAKDWLSATGCKLVFGDDGDYFYNVYYCEITTAERTAKRLGSFTAEFVCAPYKYLYSGLEEYSYSEVLSNPYALCHPTYLITGVGECDLTVNGNTLTAWITSNITIDTERMIAYTDDGEVSNTSVSGNYDELYLESGTNTITVTSGFTLTVIPNWRCL